MARLNHKKGRPTNYRKSLKNNPYWEQVKRIARYRDNFSCVDCGSVINLETHHITYYVNGKSILGRELDFINWLVTLCEVCHEKCHQNEAHRFNPKNKNKTSHGKT